MSLYWRAQILFICLSTLVGGGLWVKRALHESHSLPIDAVVSRIDRMCEWQDEGTGEVRRMARNRGDVTGRYKQTDKGTEYVEGDAVIHFTYLAPQDMVERPGELAVTGKDPRFYALKAGDPLPIRVAKDDPSVFEVQ